MKSSKGCRGFTLLELVCTIIILAVLIGVGFAGASHFWEGEEVESSARKLQSVMMRALRLSVANQEAYSVVIDPAQVRLLKTVDVPAVIEGEEIQDLGREIIPDNIHVLVKRWDEEDWKELEREVLHFPVSGICEPMGFRLVSGNDVLEFTLHPLTAFPKDQSLVAQ